jgi:hypothetical protein
VSYWSRFLLYYVHTNRLDIATLLPIYQTPALTFEFHNLIRVPGSVSSHQIIFDQQLLSPTHLYFFTHKWCHGIAALARIETRPYQNRNGARKHCFLTIYSQVRRHLLDHDMPYMKLGLPVGKQLQLRGLAYHI